MSARDALKALIIAAKSPAQIEQLASDLADLATELRERAAAQPTAAPDLDVARALELLSSMASVIAVANAVERRAIVHQLIAAAWVKPGEVIAVKTQPAWAALYDAAAYKVGTATPAGSPGRPPREDRRVCRESSPIMAGFLILPLTVRTVTSIISNYQNCQS